MTKYFFDNLIRLEEVMEEISSLVPSWEQEELFEIISETLRHEIFDVVFTALPLPQHAIFIQKFEESPADTSHILYIETFEPNIRALIEERANETKSKLVDSIRSLPLSPPS